MALKIGTCTAFLALSSMLLIGCHDHISGQQVDIDLKNLTGNWEVSSVSFKGMTGAATMTSAANDAGYADSVGKTQYRITSTKLSTIMSDELSVTFLMETDYKLDGHKVVPQNVAGETQYGFEVISLSANAMTIKPSGASDPTDLEFNLVRIDDAELATNRLKAIAQSLTYQILDFSDSIHTVFPAPIKMGESTSLSCRYQKGTPSTLTLELYAQQVTSDGKVTFSNSAPNINLAMNVTFDFSTPSEVLNVQANLAHGSTLNGVVSKGSSQASFDLGSTGSCAVNIKRVKRSLRVTSTCSSIEITPDGQGQNIGQGSLNMTTQCVLEF